MAEYIETLVGDEGKLFVEISSSTQGVGFGRAKTSEDDDKPKNQAQAFNRALDTIRLAADSVLNTLNTLAERPDIARVDFGIKFNPEIGAMIARNASESQLSVSLSWKTDKPEEETH